MVTNTKILYFFGLLSDPIRIGCFRRCRKVIFSEMANIFEDLFELARIFGGAPANSRRWHLHFPRNLAKSRGSCILSLSDTNYEPAFQHFPTELPFQTSIFLMRNQKNMVKRTLFSQHNDCHHNKSRTESMILDNYTVASDRSSTSNLNDLSCQ